MYRLSKSLYDQKTKKGIVELKGIKWIFKKKKSLITKASYPKMKYLLL